MRVVVALTTSKTGVGRVWLDMAGAADYLGVTEYWMRQKVARREIPFNRVGPKFVRFHPDDLDAYARAGRVEAVAR